MDKVENTEVSSELNPDNEYSEFTEDSQLKNEDKEDDDMDEFKKAELKIKSLLEMKMKTTNFAGTSKPLIGVKLKEEVKQENQKETSQDLNLTKECKELIKT